MAHRVYMSFMDRKGWHCQFLEADLKTPLPITVLRAPSAAIVLSNKISFLQSKHCPGAERSR
jgi:hypothetical protein